MTGQAPAPVTMTAAEARAFRVAHDVHVRVMSRKNRAELAAIYRAELAADGITLISGGPHSRDELISAIIGRRYPTGRLNESIHVLHHAPDGTAGSSACPWCHPHGGARCDCELGR